MVKLHNMSNRFIWHLWSIKVLGLFLLYVLYVFQDFRDCSITSSQWILQGSPSLPPTHSPTSWCKDATRASLALNAFLPVPFVFFFGTHLFPVGILGNLRKSSFQEVWSIYRFSWKAAKLSQQESSKKAPPPKRTARKKSNVTILDPFLTLPETNIAHESRGKPKEKGSKSNHPFSGAKMLVLRRVPSRELTYPTWGKGKSSSKCHFWGIC